MAEAVIVEAFRTARGKREGALSGVHPVDLLAQTLTASLARASVHPKDVDDVIAGCVTQAGEQSSNIARAAVLAAGMPVEVPGSTVSRLCGSGLQAVSFAAQAVMSGPSHLVVAAGIEHMTRVAAGSDTCGGEGPASAELKRRYPDLGSLGLAAERTARKWGISRKDCDAYALQSQKRAANAIEKGFFSREIIPIASPGQPAFAREEHPRPGTTPEGLAGLAPAYEDDGVITTGNSAAIADGAALAIIASKARARALGLKARARIVSMAVAGGDPLLLVGPLPATRKALALADLAASDIDLFELDESFAPVPLLLLREIGIPADRVNANGGALSLGHPLGATGAMLLASALHELERRGGRRALVAVGAGQGMGVALILDRKFD